jgi:hypothetical protein
LHKRKKKITTKRKKICLPKIVLPLQKSDLHFMNLLLHKMEEVGMRNEEEEPLLIPNFCLLE